MSLTGTSNQSRKPKQDAIKRQRIRPSQIITTFGPGSVVDLPDDSVMIAGIEHWFTEGKKYRRVVEPRLQALLDVSHFRTPPAGSYFGNDVPFVRFPQWRVCPECNALSNSFRWPKGNPNLPPVPRCDKCDKATHPVRIIVACEKGHIDDFPWHRWVHYGQKGCQSYRLRLKSAGKSGSLGDMIASCSECGTSRAMTGALGPRSMHHLRVACQGSRPWLDGEKAGCNSHLYALQRGASNIYFSMLRSTLAIPPWTDPLHQEIAVCISGIPPGVTPDIVRTIVLMAFKDRDISRVEDFLHQFERLKSERQSLRREEYDVLQAPDGLPHDDNFEAHSENIAPGLQQYFQRIVTVPRLREVRALIGFTRIDAPEIDPLVDDAADGQQGPQVAMAPLSAAKLDWLPAIENLGEGIFLQFDRKYLENWEALPEVQARSSTLIASYSAWREQRRLARLGPKPPRVILLHTIAHLMMRQLSLDAGYSSASLRERIYADDRMAGILIYTSTPDSDGSLGGLARQTRDAAAFERLFTVAMNGATICSSDPLCREHDPMQTERVNGAACHACAMCSETSCEFGNRLLDRALVIGLPSQGSLAWWNGAGIHPASSQPGSPQSSETPKPKAGSSYAVERFTFVEGVVNGAVPVRSLQDIAASDETPADHEERHIAGVDTDDSLFLLQYNGTDMNRMIPPKTWCLFRRVLPTDPRPPRDCVILVKDPRLQDANTGTVTVRRLFYSERVAADGTGQHVMVTLRAAGSGAPPVVQLQFTPAEWESWRPFARLVAVAESSGGGN